MTTTSIQSGTVHKIPLDLKKALIASREAMSLWQKLTPLARNEWICWVTFVKKEEKRRDHVKRTISELKQGVRRPCCWIGCIHRKDKSVSPSVRAVLGKRLKKVQKQ
jgi:lysozyme family protein